MKTLAFLLFMAAAALAQQRKQQEPPPTDRASLAKPRREAVDVSVRSGTELIYDDNILDLNDKQIRQLESNSKPGKFRIDEPDDFVYSIWAEVRVKGKFIGDTTNAGLKVQPYFYQSNSIANYEEYELYVRQDLGRHQAGIEYQLDRDAYLRELKHTFTDASMITTTAWESARYLEHDLEPYYLHQISPLLSVRGSAGWRAKDFDSPFDYRDIDGYFAAIGPVLRLGQGIQAFLRYEFSSMNADASSLDPDTSHRQHEIEVGGEIELFKSLEITLRYRIGFREYTSHNPLVLAGGLEGDVAHVDREDLRHKLTFRAKWKLSSSWSVRLEYVYRQVDSHRPHDNDATTAEPGDSTRNTVMIGATFVF
jgi:hypothetical protein